MEVLTWNEFKDSIKRFDCESCDKVKDGPKECEVACIDCYGAFCRWDSDHRDSILLDELRRKLNK